MKRLIKTAASDELILHSFLAYATPVELGVRLLANRLWFSVVINYCYGASSLYDGDDFNKAFDIYSEAMTAFIGISATEELAKIKSKIYENAETLIRRSNIYKEREQRMSYQIKKLFLGDADAI